MPEAPTSRPECPICLEDMDDTDVALLPCPCDYQVCLWCLRRIMQEENNRCPQCRRQYVESQFRHNPVKLLRYSEPPAAERKSSHLHDESKACNSNDNEADHREFTGSCQHHSSYGGGGGGTATNRHPVVSRLYNWSQSLLNAQVMSQWRYFGKYGRLLSIAVAKQNQPADHGSHRAGNSLVFITYASAEQATLAQQDIAKFAHRTSDLSMRNVRFHVGAARHCIQFIRGMPCASDKCPFVHSMLDRNSPKYFWKGARNAAVASASSLTAVWWQKYLAPGEAVYDAITSAGGESFFGKSVAELLPTLERLGVIVPSNAVSLENREATGIEGNLRYALARETGTLSDTGDGVADHDAILTMPKKCWCKRPSSGVVAAVAASANINDAMFPALGASLRFDSSNRAESTSSSIAGTSADPPHLQSRGPGPSPPATAVRSDSLPQRPSASASSPVASQPRFPSNTSECAFGPPAAPKRRGRKVSPADLAQLRQARSSGVSQSQSRAEVTAVPPAGGADWKAARPPTLRSLAGLVCIPPPPPCRADLPSPMSSGTTVAVTPAARISHARVTPPPLAAFAMAENSIVAAGSPTAASTGLDTTAEPGGESPVAGLAEGPGADTTTAPHTAALNSSKAGSLELSVPTEMAGVPATTKAIYRPSFAQISPQSADTAAERLVAAEATNDAQFVNLSPFELPRSQGSLSRALGSGFQQRPIPNAVDSGIGPPTTESPLGVPELVERQIHESKSTPAKPDTRPKLGSVARAPSSAAGRSIAVFAPPSSSSVDELSLRVGCGKRGMKVFLPPPGLGPPLSHFSGNAGCGGNCNGPAPCSGVQSQRLTTGVGAKTIEQPYGQPIPDARDISSPSLGDRLRTRQQQLATEKSADEWAADILGQCLQDFECGGSNSFFWDDFPPSPDSVDITGGNEVPLSGPRPETHQQIHTSATLTSASVSQQPFLTGSAAQQASVELGARPSETGWCRSGGGHAAASDLHTSAMPGYAQLGIDPRISSPAAPMRLHPSAVGGNNQQGPQGIDPNNSVPMVGSSSDQKIAEWLSNLLSHLSRSGGNQQAAPTIDILPNGMPASSDNGRPEGYPDMSGAPRRLHGSEFDYMTGRPRASMGQRSGGTPVHLIPCQSTPSRPHGGDNGWTSTYRSPIGGYSGQALPPTGAVSTRSYPWGGHEIHGAATNGSYARESASSLAASRSVSGSHGSQHPVNPIYWGDTNIRPRPEDLELKFESTITPSIPTGGGNGGGSSNNTDWMSMLQAICPNGSVTVASGAGAAHPPGVVGSRTDPRSGRKYP